MKGTCVAFNFSWVERAFSKVKVPIYKCYKNITVTDIFKNSNEKLNCFSKTISCINPSLATTDPIHNQAVRNFLNEPSQKMLPKVTDDCFCLTLFIIQNFFFLWSYLAMPILDSH